MTDRRIPGPNTERRDRPGFHAKRTTKGHPRRVARQERAAERITRYATGGIVGPVGMIIVGESGPETIQP